MPEEAERLLDAGYANRLMLDWFDREDGRHELGEEIHVLCGASPGREQSRAPQRPPFGSCTFLNAEKKCELHALSLKPIEGRVADCQQRHNSVERSIRRSVIVPAWDTEHGRAIVERWRELVGY